MDSHFKVLSLIVLFLLSFNSTAADLEQIPANEAESIQKILDLSISHMNELYDPKKGSNKQVLRDAHAKSHGCLRASFQVNSAIDKKYQVGVFSQPGKTYKAWLRYSSSDILPANDKIPDGRGMVIKLMDVPGQKILAEEQYATTQDFLLVSHSTFFVKTAEEYVEFIQKDFTHQMVKYFFPDYNPFHARWREFYHLMRIAQTGENPLGIHYFSMTPYLFSEGRAVKYSAKPCMAIPSIKINEEDPNFLRHEMQSYLNHHSACFDFQIQERIDDSTPIEDATVEWDEDKSPFVNLAKIQIAKQTFDTAEQNEFCENLSYTPWHALPEHRPLGVINRIRKVIYAAISKYRHGRNGAPRQEPSSTGFYAHP